ncbi:MAG: DEAD/DEAH box helicase [Candidatus Omnitrophica bacterium]|nr:DEAD/DEAH box helicase [Candidatus Omnitrophota bacterium]
MNDFSQLGLSKETLKILKDRGFEVPTPIQQKAIPAILTGNKDIVAQAQTGTGKTAAFGLPILEKIKPKSKSVQALVLTPTRELAIQVTEEISSFKGSRAFTIVPVYGGQAIGLQLRSLKKGVDIVVGTPGRIIDHLHRKTLKLDQIQYLVLDEADEMLNMGFLEEVEEIIKTTNENKKTLLFSATMPNEIKKIAEKYMKEYEFIKITQDQLTTSQTQQIYFEVSSSDKFEALCRIIDIEEEFYGLVFCRTKIDVDQVTSHLIERGYDAASLHGDISQNIREKTLNNFRKGVTNVLVATDVAARGIDVQNLTHVINYSLPQDPEAYVHRIGRTGRAGKEGNAITFITSEEYRKLQVIKRVIKTDIKKAKLPTVEALITTKKNRLINEINEIIQSPPQQHYLTMSQELLELNDPQTVLAALLEYSFQDTLDEKSYSHINDSPVDHKGKTRLFIKSGKVDGMDPKKLVEIIIKKCGVSHSAIRDVQVLDKFSFVTLPFNEAEIVLHSLNKLEKGDRKFVQKATQKGQDSGRSKYKGKKKFN